MSKKIALWLFSATFGLFVALWADAQVVGTLPYQLQNGTTADATQVMANFNAIVNNVNANSAQAGANTNITSLRALSNGSALAPPLAFAGALSAGLYYDSSNGTCLSANALGPLCVNTSGIATLNNVPLTNLLVPQHAVMGFNLASCPAGWVAADGTTNGGITTLDARGVALRGMDNGAGRNPAGTVAAGTYQQDALQDHNHNYNLHGSVAVQSGSGVTVSSGSSTTITGNVNSARVATETRMQNVTVLMCEKT